MHRPRPNSFSLVEMLVAMAVLSLLSLLLFVVMNDAVKMWRDQGSKEQEFREARAALYMMTSDWGTALPNTNAGWFYATSNQVAFLASEPGDAQAAGLDYSDICAVGYSLEYGRENPLNTQESQVMGLYRYVRFSNPTYTSIVNGTLPVQDIFTNPDGTNTVRELVARDVAQLQVTPYTIDNTGAVTAAPTTTTMPGIIDFNLVALNDRTAAALTTQASWLNTNAPIFLQNMETFHLRVRPLKQ